MPSKTERQRKATKLAADAGISYTAALRVIDVIAAPDADYAVTGKQSRSTDVPFAPTPAIDPSPRTARSTQEPFVSIFEVKVFEDIDWEDGPSVKRVIETAVAEHPGYKFIGANRDWKVIRLAKDLVDQPPNVVLQIDPNLMFDEETATLLLEKTYPGYRVLKYNVDDGWARITRTPSRALGADVPGAFDVQRSWEAVGLAFGTASPRVVGESRTAALPLGHGLVIAGASGTGKSAAARALVVSALLKDWEVNVIDVMKGAADYFFAHDHLTGVATSLEGAYTILRGIESERRGAYDLLMLHGAKSFWELPEAVRPPSILVVIDEFNSLVTPQREDSEQTTALRKEITRLAKTLVHVGNGLGVSLVAVAQQFSGEMPKLALADRLLMGPISGTQAESLLNFPRTAFEEETLDIRGRGFYEERNSHGYQIQGWFQTPDEYLNLLAEHRSSE